MAKKTAAYMIISNPDTTLYPPISLDSHTDFFVLTNISTLKSDFWQIIFIDNLSEIECSIHSDPKTYLGLYDEYINIKSEQIITGKLSEYRSCIVSVPPIETLLPPDISLVTPVLKPFSLNPTYSDGPYNGYPLQLSICLLMSNRLDSIKSCLDSLNPLLTELEAELIIVDSSSDGSTEVAKQYEATIIPYTWVNDFAAARNTAIQAAKGSWILSIDDDEWFDDASEIIQFFKSEQWKKSDTAFYKVRNYTDPDGITFGDCYVQRMVKNHPKLHYIYPVHESLDLSFLHRKPYAKYFNCFAHHYGYAYVSEKDKEKKIYRNIAGLYTALLVSPFDFRQHQQLCNELTILRNYTAATAYAFKLLSICKLQEKSNPIEALHWKRIAIVFLYTIGQISGNNQLIRTAKELTIWKEYNSFQLASINNYLAINAFINEDFKEVCAYANRYYSFRNEYLKATNKHIQSFSIFTDLVEPEDKLTSLMVSHAYSASKLGLESQVEELLGQINFNLLDNNSIQILVKVYCNLSQIAFTKHFPNVNDVILEGLYRHAKFLYNKMLNAETDDSKGAEYLMELDTKITTANCLTEVPVIRLIHLYAYPDDSSSYHWFFNNVNALNLYIEDVFLCAAKNGHRLANFLVNLKLETIQQAIRSLVSLTLSEFKEMLDVNLIEKKNEYSSVLHIKEIYFLSAILETALFNKLIIWEKDSNEYKDYFIMYIDLMSIWTSSNYIESMFLDDNFDLLPATCRGAYYIKKGMIEKDLNNITQSMDFFKAAVTECPLFDSGVKLLIMEFKSLGAESKTVSEKQPKSEFELLGEQLKSTAKQLIDTGRFEEAENILLQLSSLLPGDKDIVGLISHCKASNLPN